MDSHPAKKKRKRITSPIQPRVDAFQKNDLELLYSGMLADGTIKCQGRTWGVHRALLSSRLKFFKAAFCGSFAEATSKEVDLPEATPDSVDVMIRHLYGEDLDLDALNTPLLCVCSWRLADYVQLDTLKSVAVLALQVHLNAMLLLASSDRDLKKIKPIWLTHFMDAFREVCAHTVLQPLQNEFVAFLWITRFEMLDLSEIWEVLDNHQDVRYPLLQLLIRQRFSLGSDWPLLVPFNWLVIEREIHTRYRPGWEDRVFCSRCDKEKLSGHDGKPVPDEPWFYNQLPINGHIKIGEMKWCKSCADEIVESRSWPWRDEDIPRKQGFHLRAWRWTDGDHKSK